MSFTKDESDHYLEQEQYDDEERRKRENDRQHSMDCPQFWPGENEPCTCDAE